VRSISLHYQGQSFELPIQVPPGEIDIPALEEAFGVEHERTYGHRAGPEEPVELVTVKIIGIGVPDRPRLPDAPPTSVDLSPPSRRPAYFGPQAGWLDTLVIGRASLEGGVAGPCVIEEYDCTCVVPPGCRADLDRFGNITIEIGGLNGI
jgi:N-methylhydantoinase A